MPYDNVSCGLIRFVVGCGTPRMSSPTMEICNHFVGEDTILPLKLASDCMRADIEYIPTMWLDVVDTKKYYKQYV